MKDPANKFILYSLLGVIIFYWGFGKAFDK